MEVIWEQLEAQQQAERAELDGYALTLPPSRGTSGGVSSPPAKGKKHQPPSKGSGSSSPAAKASASKSPPSGKKKGKSRK